MRDTMIFHDYESNVFEYTLEEIINIINADRSDEWIDYDATDWKDGLEFTNLIYICGDK